MGGWVGGLACKRDFFPPRVFLFHFDRFCILGNYGSWCLAGCRSCYWCLTVWETVRHTLLLEPVGIGMIQVSSLTQNWIHEISCRINGKVPPSPPISLPHQGWYEWGLAVLQKNELEAGVWESYRRGDSLTHFAQSVFEVKDYSVLEN